MVPIRLSSSVALTLEKAMWLSRILRIIDIESLNAAEVSKRIEQECHGRGMKPLSIRSISRYLKEMVKSERLVVTTKSKGRKRPRVFYNKPIKPEVTDGKTN